MVPVRLRLRNFLSYGEHSEPLDFEQFHVACLSGGNGQGKSALLDAMTWALWGEARKSAEARKPDEELLRIGAREMEVDFEFDLEGERYRIVRAFYRTASGKTTKATLEFQVRDDAAGGWRALTDTTTAKTQDLVTRTLRLDYDTFINSAFLLQGRSDEFTKKKPTDRKQILARILGLDRFDRLQKGASAHVTATDARCKALEAEVERLQAALEVEPSLRDEMEGVEAQLAAQQAALAEARAAEAVLAQRLAELDALAARADAARGRLATAEATVQDRREQQIALAARLQEAESLMEHADRVKADVERHEELSAQSRALDEKRHQVAGLTEQLSQLREQVRQRQQERRDRLTRLEAELQSCARELREKQAAEAELPPTQKALAAAREGERRAEGLRQRLSERRARVQRLEDIGKRLAHARGTLQARIEEGARRLREAEALSAEVPALRERCTSLTRQQAHADEREGELMSIREQGIELAAQIRGLDADVERLQREVADVDHRAAQLDALETEDCPTCGTRLTDAHRSAVHQTYADEKEALIARIEQTQAERQRLETDRAGLRERYGALQQEVAALRPDAQTLASVNARLREAEGAQDQVAPFRDALRVLQGHLADNRYEPELQAERTEIEEALAAEAVDDRALEGALEDALRDAAQRRSLEERVHDLTARVARAEELRRLIARHEADLAPLRAELAGGGEGPLTEQVAATLAQIERLGYDGARHDEVQRELRALDRAPKRYHDLLAARERVVEWKERRQRYAEEEAEARRVAEGLRAELEEAAGGLAERPGVQARRGEQAALAASAESGLHEAQARRGAIGARLERCVRERAALADARAAHKEARRERNVWRKLRAAFGKSGIPALIIEETLPELEERANGLLERLSSGRTRVHLETLRDNKSGGTRETLDIRITDDHGAARAYETFSGGEAFRVNFALRIALAQLLAERAGVRVRTLVIDEGFGTQDKEGVEALVGAIQAIREDFEKVLVITHLDELKEAFPVRIEVQKHPVEGSRYDVIGV